ncbi:hypothetical protein QZH41_015845 [Actinostola sp. cb2023]|nr:hypothetical protein QZH41_015845 [Actinostola sp. cb2023]
MAADATLKSSCQESHDNLFFDYVGENPAWKPVSLTHVEYPRGEFGFGLQVPYSVLAGGVNPGLHYSQSTTVWDDLLDNLWKHAVATGTVMLSFAVAFSRPVSEFLMLRDSTLIPSVMWFEYTQSRAETR